MFNAEINPGQRMHRTRKMNEIMKEPIIHAHSGKKLFPINFK
jgi:hypothetical protein